MPTNPTPQTPAEWRAEQERVLGLLEAVKSGEWAVSGKYVIDHMPKFDENGARLGNTPSSIATIDYCVSPQHGYQDVSQGNAALIAAAPDLATAYAEACGQIAALLEQDRWIPVEERLPEMDMELLMYSCTGKVISGEWRSGEWEDDAGFGPLRTNYITHWRPLPAPPAPASAEGGAE